MKRRKVVKVVAVVELFEWSSHLKEKAFPHQWVVPVMSGIYVLWSCSNDLITRTRIMLWHAWCRQKELCCRMRLESENARWSPMKFQEKSSDRANNWKTASDIVFFRIHGVIVLMLLRLTIATTSTITTSSRTILVCRLFAHRTSNRTLRTPQKIRNTRAAIFFSPLFPPVPG